MKAPGIVFAPDQLVQAHLLAYKQKTHTVSIQHHHFHPSQEPSIARYIPPSRSDWFLNLHQCAPSGVSRTPSTAITLFANEDETVHSMSTEHWDFIPYTQCSFRAIEFREPGQL